MSKSGGLYDIVHYIKFPHVEIITDIVFNKFNQLAKGFIMTNLRKKIKKKNQSFFIDAAFVLRIYLEYYRRERINKLEKIKVVLIYTKNIINKINNI